MKELTHHSWAKSHRHRLRCYLWAVPSESFVVVRLLRGVHVCKALSDSQGSVRPAMSQVVALLGNDWRQPLHLTITGLSPQQFEFQARHFRDLTTESYVTDCAQIVVYHCWAAQTALNADWDTMAVTWVVGDSLWNVSCTSAQRRKQLVKSWQSALCKRRPEICLSPHP